MNNGTFLHMADNEQIVKEIAERLGETNEIPLWQITKIVERNGADFAYFMVELAEEIHREGLMMVLDGSRPRTLGGVFFNAVRDGLAYKFRYEIFPPHDVKEKRIKHDIYVRNLPLFNWEGRANDLAPIFSKSVGEVKSVNIVLRGNPKHIESRQEVVVFRMELNPTKADLQLPREMPPLPTEPSTYIVYVAMRQWKKNIAKSVAKGQGLMVDGACVLDTALNAIVVYARGIKLLPPEVAPLEADATPQDKEAPVTSQATLVESKQAAPTNKKETVVASQPATPSKKEVVPATKAPVASKPTQPAKEVTPKPTATPTPAKAETPSQPAVETAPPSPEDAQLAQFDADLAAKLRPLYSARKMFEKRYQDIMAKPENERSGLQVAKMMLERTEQQIALLEGTNK